mgnify:CR=1 FL=1
MRRTVVPGLCALMGATRLASGIFQQPRDASPPLVIEQELELVFEQTLASV